MPSVNRRRFIQLSGGTVAAGTLSTSIARAAAIPANRTTGTLKDVEHVVVLMQENRSFDHYFGTLRGVRGFGDPHPVTLPSGKSVWHQSDGTSDVLPFRPDRANLGLTFIEDLAHDWVTTHQAWNQGNYDKWVPAKGSTTMAYLTREDIPFHYALADAFTVCDAYHCSLLTCTDPNRYYMWTGYTGNNGVGGGPVLDNAEAGYGWSTFPEVLQKAGVSWKIYQDAGDGLDADGYWGWTEDAYIGNYGDNSLLYFDRYRNAQPGDPLYDKARTGTNVSAGDGYFDILKSDVLTGKLPQVSWVVAPEAFTEHPNWPANYGAWYVSQVLDALTADPAVWSRTALIICFDENDGFFDHVVPPTPPASAANGASTVDVAADLYAGDAENQPGPYGLGPRVPMLVVSPWSTGGWVCSEVLDHTSIIRFVEQRFGVHEPNISEWRRTICGDLTSAFDFSREVDRVPPLPSTAAYVPPNADRYPSFVPVPPASPKLPVQERGLRPARPLPYDLAADASVTPAGRLRIAFASHGGIGANFFVTSATQPGGPWTYTVGAGRDLAGTWNVSGQKQGAYDFSVHGPNGFVRRFTGTAGAAGPEVGARHFADSCLVELTLTNHGAEPARLTVADSYGNQEPITYTVRPGATALLAVNPKRSNGWYDVSVTSAQDKTFLRRLAGHVETGRPSTSDPAIITG
ncbi:MAG TPA: phospholipase C, phosphocholine-specific [Actinocrinis sp.]|nr:phospholipase C, phosphocholine-specific [Actinocrinis sp.]